MRPATSSSFRTAATISRTSPTRPRPACSGSFRPAPTTGTSSRSSPGVLTRNRRPSPSTSRQTTAWPYPHPSASSAPPMARQFRRLSRFHGRCAEYHRPDVSNLDRPRRSEPYDHRHDALSLGQGAPSRRKHRMVGGRHRFRLNVWHRRDQFAPPHHGSKRIELRDERLAVARRTSRERRHRRDIPMERDAECGRLSRLAALPRDSRSTTYAHEEHDIRADADAWQLQLVRPGVLRRLPSRDFGHRPVHRKPARLPTTPPSTITPADNATNVASPVTFTWTPVTRRHALSRLRPLERPRHAHPPRRNRRNIAHESASRRSFRLACRSGIRSCPPLKSAEVHFTIPQSQNCTNTPSQLLAPANGATVSDGTGNLRLEQRERRERLRARGPRQRRRRDAGHRNERHAVHETHDRGEGRVVGDHVRDGCSTVESQHSTFTIPATNCPTNAPLLLAPRYSGVVTSPVIFQWTPVTGATRYRGVGGDERRNAEHRRLDQSDAVELGPPRRQHPVVRRSGRRHGCPTLRSALSPLKIIPPPPCATPARPSLEAPGAAVSGSRYTVRWTNVPNAGSFELQEATKDNFSDATTTSVTGNSMTFTHTTTAIAKYLYRVRAISACSDDHGRYSDVVAVTILPQKPSSSQQHISAEFGGTNPVTQTIFLRGQSSPVTFTATANKPWITITPSSGTLPTPAHADRHRRSEAAQPRHEHRNDHDHVRRRELGTGRRDHHVDDRTPIRCRSRWSRPCLAARTRRRPTR